MPNIRPFELELPDKDSGYLNVNMPEKTVQKGATSGKKSTLSTILKAIVYLILGVAGFFLAVFIMLIIACSMG